MKRFVMHMFALAFVGGALFLASCTKTEQTNGMLTLRVMQPVSQPVPWEEVYIAKSLENLEAHIYFDSGQTNVEGYVKFDSLSPGVYWYDTRNWEDYGAVEVYLDIDTHAVLWVNTPGGPEL